MGLNHTSSSKYLYLFLFVFIWMEMVKKNLVISKTLDLFVFFFKYRWRAAWHIYARQPLIHQWGAHVRMTKKLLKAKWKTVDMFAEPFDSDQRLSFDKLSETSKALQPTVQVMRSSLHLHPIKRLPSKQTPKKKKNEVTSLSLVPVWMQVMRWNYINHNPLWKRISNHKSA